MEIDLEQFIENLVSSGLMTAAEVEAFQETQLQGKRPADAAELARSLVQRRVLTRYQAAAIYQGKTRGLVLGEYTILEKIGSGGMGQVYKAKHRTMDRLVALKILPVALTDPAGAIKRFRREVRAAARLMHPNIVTALDAGEQDGIPYLVMEYVEGADLARIVQDRGPLGIGEAVGYIIQAARGLAYAHEQGVIHRDIKPGNLLLDQKGVIKILDMGLARVDQMAGPTESTVSLRFSSRGKLLGTCDYMAPEQADAVHYVDNRADVYALGCTLFRLLAARPPYRGTAAQVLLAHREAAIPSLREIRPDVPPALEAVVQKMIAKQPGNRHRTMAEVISALEDCLVSPSPSGQAVAVAIAAGGGVGPSVPQEVVRGNSVPVALALDDAALAGEPLIEGIEVELDLAPSNDGRRRRRRWRLVGLAATGVAAALGLAVLLFRGLAWQPAEDLPGGVPVPAPLSHGPALTAAGAREYQAYWASRFGLPTEMVNSLGGRLSLIPQGAFDMGSTRAEIHETAQLASQNGEPEDLVARLSSEGPQHPVSMTKPYYIGRHEVTVGEFRRFVDATGYRTDAEKGQPEEGSERTPTGKARETWRSPGFAESESDPVVEVSWNDAMAFCRWLGERESRRYRLPTEAEWEYACRAGTATRYNFGDRDADLGAHGWYQANAAHSPHTVGRKQPNAWGVYDMHGNVEEWCQDWYDPRSYENAPPIDLSGPDSGSGRVIRGGGWSSAFADCRSAARRGDDPASHSPSRGFRIVLAR